MSRMNSGVVRNSLLRWAMIGLLVMHVPAIMAQAASPGSATLDRVRASGKFTVGYYANAQIETMACGVPTVTYVREEFLTEQLRPELLAQACSQAGIPLTLRRQPGYDHSYYFISTFMDDHLRWHATRLKAAER